MDKDKNQVVIIIISVSLIIGVFVRNYLKLYNLHFLVIPVIILIIGSILWLKLQKTVCNKTKGDISINYLKLFMISLFSTLGNIFKILKTTRIKGFIKSKPFIVIAIFQIINISIALYYKTQTLYTLFLLIAIFSLVFSKFSYLVFKYRNIQNLLNYNFNNKIYLKSWNKERAILFTMTPLHNKDKELLEIAFNSGIINDLISTKKNKHIYHIELDKYKTNNYTKLSIGSKERLTLILKEMKFKPKFINKTKHDNSKVYSYQLDLNPRKIKHITSEIENKLGIKNNTLTITNINGYFSFEIRNTTNQIYLLSDMIKTINVKNEELPVLVGVEKKRSTPVIKDFVKLNHLLIAGKSGSGKSTTLKGIIESIMYMNMDKVVWLMLDFGESALNRYRNFNNVKYIDVYDDNCEIRKDDIHKEIDNLCSVMIQRTILFKKSEVEKLSEYNQDKKDKLPYIMFTIDEANGFKTVLQIKDDKDEIATKIMRLLTQGRKYGIFLIFGVQQTNDKQFFKDWKTQTSRIAHKLTEKVDVENATGSSELNEIVPKLQMGDFILDIKDSEENAILKGTLTDKNNDLLYKYLKKEFTDNEQIINNHNENTKVSLDKREAQ